MKIAVSTIAKNEAKNVAAFVKACKEADVISVLDTGSTDDTVKLLKKHGALAGVAKFKKFRFDEARNKALALLPKDVDVVVSIDMDERLQPGWRAALERAWRPGMDALSYWYIAEWQDAAQTIPAVPGWRTKIFKRHGTKWFRPVHEVPLLADGRYPNGGLCKEVVVHHYQTGVRNYEPLLSELIATNPQDEDSYMQRAPEWQRMGEHKKAVDDYERYLALTALVECPQPQCDRCQLVAGRRAYAHIGIAQAKHALGYAPHIIVGHFLNAVASCPGLREAWTYLADGHFATGNYPAAYGAAMTALSITDNGIQAMDMRCWGDFPKTLADNALARILAGEVRAPMPTVSQTPTAAAGPLPPQKRLGQSIADEHLARYFGGLVRRIAEIPGDIIECGVCHGYSFTQIALALYKSRKQRTLYGLDVWSVMPKPGPEDASAARAQGITDELARFEGAGAQGSPKEVRQRLEAAGIPKKWIEKHVVLIKGDIKKTLPKLKGKKFAFVHLDVDTHASYAVALKHLWPALAEGGVTAFDEYGDSWWPGADTAIDTYLGQHKGAFRFGKAKVGDTVRHFVIKSARIGKTGK